MKTGRTITELAQELERQQAAKQDFVADTRDVTMAMGDTSAALELDGVDQGYPIQPAAHRQIRDRLGIPSKYYQRMLEGSHRDRNLLLTNVNHWFRHKPEKRMIRTMDGHTRAFLSDRYRRLDNVEMMASVLPVLADSDAEIVSCEVTENRLYLKGVWPRLRGEVAVGDVVQSGFVISNSEIGLGGIKAETMLYRLVCLNGMITGASMNRHHVGRRIQGDAESYEVFQDETLKADDQAFWMKVRDVVAATANSARFESVVERFRAAKEERIEDVGKVGEVVTETVKMLELPQATSGQILRNLIMSGNMNRFGMVNAVTRAAQSDDVDYDTATEMERAGGRLLALPTQRWADINHAAVA